MEEEEEEERKKIRERERCSTQPPTYPPTPTSSGKAPILSRADRGRRDGPGRAEPGSGPCRPSHVAQTLVKTSKDGLNMLSLSLFFYDVIAIPAVIPGGKEKERGRRTLCRDTRCWEECKGERGGGERIYFCVALLRGLDS